MNDQIRQTFKSRTTIALAQSRIRIVRKKFDDGKEVTTLAGYPVVWGSADGSGTTSSDRGGYKVRLVKNSATFQTPTLALWNHDFAKPLAGTNNGTLRILAADDIGVPVEIDLDLNTSAGKDALAYVSSGLVGGMSFSMANGFEEYMESKEGDDYILNVSKYTVDEVTITPIPAFTATTIGVKLEPEEEPKGTPPVAGGMSQHHPNRIAAAMQVRQNRLYLLKAS